MKAKLIFGLAVAVFVLSSQYATAAVTINEIMYDPDGSDTNREWVELYNDGGSSVDLSAWKFVEAGVNHGLTNFSGGTSIPSGGYAIIALDAGTFSSEWGGGIPIFDSSFSLGNTTGETLSLKDSAGNTSYTVTYDPTLGANDDGNSLQKYNGSWLAADETAGSSNTNADNSSSDEENTGGSGDSNNTSETTQSTAIEEEPQKTIVHDEWQLSLFAPSYGIAGDTSSFTTDVRNLYDQKVHPGRYVWNMGDGTIYDGKEYSDVTHIYDHAGEYVIILDYWRVGALEKEMSVRHVFSVRDGSLSIKGIVRSNNLLDVQVTNSSGNEMDISGWLISSDQHAYFVPQNTFVLGNSSITLSGKSTGLINTDEPTLKVTSPNGEVVATTILEVAPVVYSVNRTSTVESSDSNIEEGNIENGFDESLLTANVKNASKNQSGAIWWLGAFGLVALGIVAVIFLRESQTKKKEEDVFEIKLVE